MGNNRTDSCTAFKPCTSIQTIVGTVVSPISLMAAVCVPPLSTPWQATLRTPFFTSSAGLSQSGPRPANASPCDAATASSSTPQGSAAVSVGNEKALSYTSYLEMWQDATQVRHDLRCRWHGPKTIYNGSHVGCQLRYASGEPTSPLHCGTTCHRYQVPCSSAHQYLDSMFDCPGHDTAKICVGCAARGMACVFERI